MNLNEKLNLKYLYEFNCSLYLMYNVKLIFKYPYKFKPSFMLEV
jgi:hypothetical protein